MWGGKRNSNINSNTIAYGFVCNINNIHNESNTSKDLVPKLNHPFGNMKLQYVPKHTSKQKEEQKPKIFVKLPLNCVVNYYQCFIPKEKATEIFENLIQNLDWENRGMMRDTVLIGDQDVLYRYGKGYGEESTPKPWPPVLLALRDEIESTTETKFDICLCGLYLDGTKGIGFHCDREELGKKTPIASVSLGAERIFQFRPKNKEEEQNLYSLTLHHGTLLVMGENCQDRYVHSLPIDKSIKTTRINLTFRNSKGENPQDWVPPKKRVKEESKNETNLSMESSLNTSSNSTQNESSEIVDNSVNNPSEKKKKKKKKSKNNSNSVVMNSGLDVSDLIAHCQRSPYDVYIGRPNPLIQSNTYK